MTNDVPRIMRVASEWTPEDRRGAVRCRLGNQRRPYRVEPGLYAVGRPDADSPVLASASYKLSFDILRKDLGNRDCWILVLDTNGMSVCCAAATGAFATEEVVARIQKARLAEVVRHRRLILPQLGAPAVQAREVSRHTGFEILVGPMRSADIPAYLSGGNTTTEAMRTVRFSLRDRLVLTPAEVVQSLMRFPAFAFAALIVTGLGPDGVSLGRAWAGAWPLFGLGLGSICAGSFLAPLLLPLIPLPTLAARGWVHGLGLTAALLHAVGLAFGMDPFLVVACYLFFPAASAAMAISFAGAVPLPSIPGVRAELRMAFPFFIAAALLSVAALAISKLRQWGMA